LVAIEVHSESIGGIWVHLIDMVRNLHICLCDISQFRQRREPMVVPPMDLFELVLSIWLLVKGLRPIAEHE